MPNKYYETISKIQASDELKQKIIENMKQENMNQLNKEGVKMKAKKAIVSIIAVISVLLGSGVVYAAMGGTIFGRPALELIGINFTEKYEEYVVPVENQSIADDNIKLDLMSTVSDSGFIVLNFNLKYSENYIENVKEKYIERGWTDEEIETRNIMYPGGISFNDLQDEEGEWLHIHSSYDTVIIDGKKLTIRGRSLQDIQEVVKGQEYEIYVLYFLADYELEGKEEFTLTLKTPVVEYIDDRSILDSKYSVLDGQFDINISKEKAINNSRIISGNNTEIKIGNFINKVEKIVLTPLQNIIKITTINANRTSLNDCNTANEDYINDAEYLLYNSDTEEAIPFHEITANIEYVHKDGTKTKAGPEEEMEMPEIQDGDDVVETTYIIFEQSEETNNVLLNVYSNDQFEDIVNLMGTYNINISRKTIEPETKNEQINMSTRQFDMLRWFGDDPSAVWNIPLDDKDSNENIILYQGEEIKADTGIQKLEMMEVTPENIDRLSTNYYNYGKGKFYGKYKYLFGDYVFLTDDDKEVAYIDTYYGDFSFTKKVNAYPRTETRYCYSKYYKTDMPDRFIELYPDYELDLIEIDLDGNGKNEYIVCAQRAYAGNASETLPYSVVALYDSNFNKLADLAIEKSIETEGFDESYWPDLYGTLSGSCVQCIDLDDDNVMEILIDFWSEDYISILKYNNGTLKGETNVVVDEF